MPAVRFEVLKAPLQDFDAVGRLYTAGELSEFTGLTFGEVMSRAMAARELEWGGYTFRVRAEAPEGGTDG